VRYEGETTMAPAKKQKGKGAPPIPAAKAVPKRSGGHHNKAANSAAHRKAQAEMLAKRKAQQPALKRGANGSGVLVVQGDKPRPTIYDAELAEKICLRFATDPDMTLNILNAEPDMPTVYTLYDWLRDHSEFEKLYARSRDIQYDLQAERLKQLARTPLIGTIKVTRTGGKDGGSTEVREHDNVDRTRLIIDTDKWILSKMRPKKYGLQPFEADGNDALQELLGQFRARSKEIEDAS
jgi:hypothetical protein